MGTISMSEAITLVALQPIPRARIIGKHGGWQIALEIGPSMPMLRSKRGGLRMFTNLSTAQQTLTSKLGIHRFEVDATWYRREGED